MSHVDVPLGFRGFDPHREIRVYRRHLPHWRQEGATYFVTFRLADSLPAAKQQELRSIKELWAKEAAVSKTEAERMEMFEAAARMTFVKAEQWLDQGYGDCVLRSSAAQSCIVEALHFFDGEHYEIGCFVVMANHVHLVLRPFGGNELEAILQSRKSKMAKDINALHEDRKQGGPLWQQESYDRIIRDGDHLQRCIRYIGRNGDNANFPEGEFRRWINPEWVKLGWDFET